MFISLRFILIFVSILIIPVGCTKKLEIVPVSGQLTLDGKPVADCVVRFSLVQQPEGLENTPSMGRTNREGFFTLKTMKVLHHYGIVTKF
jgi:hypothetical protein